MLLSLSVGGGEEGAVAGILSHALPMLSISVLAKGIPTYKAEAAVAAHTFAPDALIVTLRGAGVEA